MHAWFVASFFKAEGRALQVIFLFQLPASINIYAE
jgi:hypothetical protein